MNKKYFDNRLVNIDYIAKKGNAVFNFSIVEIRAKEVEARGNLRKVIENHFKEWLELEEYKRKFKNDLTLVIEDFVLFYEI